MASSFLEKLKKGMKIEASEQTEESSFKAEGVEIEEAVKPKVEKTSVDKTKSSKKKQKVDTADLEVKQEPTVVLAATKAPKKAKKKEEWLQPEGELAVDVYQTDSQLIIQSAIAGVKPENIDIEMDDDVIIIKGIREKPSDNKGDYFSQECYWGPFSRKIISPVEIDPGRVEANLKDGILTIKIPKIVRDRKKKLVVKKV